ncbi:MAG: deoxyribodipyrimidine photo-lyase, partial [Vicinamibacterales bacterium]
TEQYAARTIRPRIHRHLDRFLIKGPEPVAEVEWPAFPKLRSLPATEDVLDGLRLDGSVLPVAQPRGGTSQGRRRLTEFVAHALARYHDDRNHPEVDGTSALSPYLHFGHLGPREVALAIRAADAPADAREAFLEQLIVRRELAINFVRNNDAYDRLDGCEPWARQTLRRHEHDPRPYRYSEEEFEAGATHDPLWNAAQRQMVTSGWMHGYVRMYWAKKILEWSANAAAALQTAIVLNDRYELDGRDPNGYTNIAWAIGGKHDRPWPSRPVYGTIRSMSFASTSRKFDVRAYVERYGSSADVQALARLLGKP